MIERAKVFLIIAGIAAVVTMANMRVDLAFVQSHIFKTSGTWMPTAGESSLDLAYKLRYFLTIAAAVFLSVGIFAALFVSGELSRPFLEVKEQNVRPGGMNGAAKKITDGTPQGKPLGDDPHAGLVLSSSPADTPNFARKGSADVKPARAKLPGARVLVVGGADTDLDAARESLKPYGMRVDCVTSGRSAVKSIREGM
ncbi:MAG: hypothetical protein LBQ19_06310, partial [Synergistaceae bacterium]|nr:hypothetical protein [Synergistaceae bacterium]